LELKRFDSNSKLHARFDSIFDLNANGRFAGPYRQHCNKSTDSHSMYEMAEVHMFTAIKIKILHK